MEGREMVKGILTVVAVVALVALLGCSEISGLTGSSSTKGPDIVRRAELVGKWQMDQTRIHVGAGEESLVLLRLAYGDEVEGYFYLEKGEDIEFKITGNTQIYEAKPASITDSGKTTSDRFSFVASQEQGTTYTLSFRNPTESEVTVFLELIYPIMGSLFFPIAAD
jgi:hypothetical protein